MSIDIDDDDKRTLSHAVAAVMKRPIKAPGSDIPFALLQRAVNIDRRQSKVGPAGYRNSMPTIVHSEREIYDAEVQRQIHAAEPDTTTHEYELLIGLSGTPSREEVALLEAVDRTFRKALTKHSDDLRERKTETRDPIIDYQILWQLAAGLSQRHVAKRFGIKQPLVARIKRERLVVIYREVIEQVRPKVSRAAPAGIRDSNGSSDGFDNYTIFVAEQRNLRSYGRESTYEERKKMGHSKNGSY